MFGAAGMLGQAFISHGRKNIGDVKNAWALLNTSVSDWNGPGAERWRAQVEASDLPPNVKRKILRSRLAGGTTPAANLTRSARVGSDTIISNLFNSIQRYQGIPRSAFEGTPEAMAAALKTHGASVPGWLRLALVSASDEATMLSKYTGSMTDVDPELARSLGLEGTTTRLQEAMDEYKTWDAVMGAIFNETAGVDRERYLQVLNQRIREYSNVDELAGAGGRVALGGYEHVRGRILGGKYSIIASNKDMVIQDLQAQGKTKLAAALREISPDLDILGINIPGSGNGLSEIRVGKHSRAMSSTIENTRNWLAIPVLDEGGTFTRGAGAQNLYHSRQQIFINDLVEAVQNVNGPNFKPIEAMDLDVWAAKTVSQFYGNIDEGQRGNFLRWMAERVDRASTWDVSAWRAHRLGLSPNKYMEYIRQSQAMVQLPDDVNLARAMGMPIGEAALFDPTMQTFSDSRVHDAMRQSGFAQLSSESAARNAVFEDVNRLFNISFGAMESPVDKPMRDARDFGKPYSVMSTRGTKAVEAWIPFATETQRQILKGNEPVVTRAFGLFEEELNAVRDLYQMATNASYTPDSDFLRNMTVAERQRVLGVLGLDKANKSLMRDLANLADVSEGIVASAIPGHYHMESIKNLTVQQLNLDLLGDDLARRYEAGLLTANEIKKALIGKSVSRNTHFGLQSQTRQFAQSTFAGKKHGHVQIMDVSVTDKGFTFELAERYPMSRAKVGSHAFKSETLPISPRNVEKLMDMLNIMRKNKQFSELYSNQAIIPLLTAPERGVTSTFAMASSLRKVQSLSEVGMTNILTEHMPKMTGKGRSRVYKALKQHGVKFSRAGGRYSATVPTVAAGSVAEAREPIRQAIYGLMESIWETPEKFFDTGGQRGLAYWEHSGRFITNPKLLAATMEGAGRQNVILGLHALLGLTTTVTPWNTLETGLPKTAGITMHELQFLKKMGLESSRAELMSRRIFNGDASETAKFWDMWTRSATAGGESTFRVPKDISKRRFTLDDVSSISRRRIDSRTSVNPDSPWRFQERFKSNFVVDLTTAHASKDRMTGKVLEALGTTEVLVPGAKTDLWGRAFFAGGVLTEAERYTFMGPLERMLGSVSKYYETGLEEHLATARTHQSEYRKQVLAVKTMLESGRGSVTPDVGPWTAGIVTHRDYRKQFKNAIGEEAASHVVGVTEKQYKQMLQQGAVERTINGNKFLTGYSKRYPVTSFDPVLVYADPELSRRGGQVVAMGEAHRLLKQLDYDGDMLIIHAVQNKASAMEIMNIVRNKDGQKKGYRELLRQNKYMGGAGEELAGRAEMGMADNATAVFAERVKKFGTLTKRRIAELMTKYHTSRIGEYSNLSKSLAAMTAAINNQSMEQAIMRLQIAENLQQLAIDFARASSRTTNMDPGQMARDIRNAIMYATEHGDVKTGNAMMRKVFEESNLMAEGVERFAENERTLTRRFFELEKQRIMAESRGKAATVQDIDRRRRTIQASLAENRELQSTFNNLMGDFFGDLDSSAGKRYFEATRAMLLKDVSLSGTPEEVEAKVAYWSRILAEGGEEGVIPSVGRMASEQSADHISDINRAIKAAGAMKEEGGHILRGALRSPAGKAAITLGAVSTAAAAAVGFLTPPTELNTGSMAHKQIQRTPDAAMVGADGEAPIPGSRGGQVGTRMGPTYLPRNEAPQMGVSRRMYYNQSNRMPNITTYSQGDPQAQYYDYADAEHSMRQTGASRTNMNVINSPNARRLSNMEMRDRAREELTR